MTYYKWMVKGHAVKCNDSYFFNDCVEVSHNVDQDEKRFNYYSDSGLISNGCFFIVSDQVANELIDNTNELVLYDHDLHLYLWAIVQDTNLDNEVEEKAA